MCQSLLTPSFPADQMCVQIKAPAQEPFNYSLVTCKIGLFGFLDAQKLIDE